MREQRSELRDEVIALLAASRELSPDHDRALAEVFVDSVERGIARQPRSQHVFSPIRHLLGALVLALACVAGFVTVLGAAHTSSVQVRAYPGMQAGPFAGKLPLIPRPPKVVVVPLAPKPVVPPVIKQPQAPKPPVPKVAP